jgi:hypothetical protein
MTVNYEPVQEDVSCIYNFEILTSVFHLTYARLKAKTIFIRGPVRIIR